MARISTILLSVVDAAALDATYERVLTENSVSRGEISYMRHVFARLQANRAINSLPHRGALRRGSSTGAEEGWRVVATRISKSITTDRAHVTRHRGTSLACTHIDRIESLRLAGDRLV